MASRALATIAVAAALLVFVCAASAASQCDGPVQGLTAKIYQYGNVPPNPSPRFNVVSPWNGYNASPLQSTTTYLIQAGALDFQFSGPAALTAAPGTFPFGHTKFFVADIIGTLTAPVSGSYSFRSTNDDGLVLSIDDTNAGGPPNTGGFLLNVDRGTDTKSYTLASGAHPFRAIFDKFAAGFDVYGIYTADGALQLKLEWLVPGADVFTAIPASAFTTDFCCDAYKGFDPATGQCSACKDGPACLKCQADNGAGQCIAFDPAKMQKGCPLAFTTIARGQRCGGDRDGCCQSSNVGSAQNQYPKCNNPFVASKPAYCGQMFNGHAQPWSCPGLRCTGGDLCACNAPECTCTSAQDLKNYAQNLPAGSDPAARCGPIPSGEAFASKSGCFF